MSSGEIRRHTLQASFLRQNSIAAASALAVMLLLVLLLADRATMAVAAKTLSSDLDQVDSVEQFSERFKGMGSRIVLDSQGAPVTMVKGPGAGRGMGAQERKSWAEGEGAPWELAGEVVDKGELSGYGELPWAEGKVLWAAQTKQLDSGETRIMVVWAQPGSVRAEGWPIYIIGISGVIVSFALNMAFSLGSARKISGNLIKVANTGSRMAGGDYDVDLPRQEILELDRISSSLNALASQLRSVNEELGAEAKRLVKLEETQRRFIADASHEIRAPLATIAITLDAWKDGLLSDEEKTDAITHIRSEIGRLSLLAGQLLDLSSIESGRQRIELGAVDAAEVAERVIAGYKGIEGAPIAYSKPEGRLMAMADEQGLHRMLRNLIDNARGFTPPYGHIDVRVSRDGEGVLIEVKDDGPGIPADELPHMWDRFARAERERASGKSGTGLGLAIVKALADAMRAEVELANVDGGGTRASIRLGAASLLLR